MDQPEAPPPIAVTGACDQGGQWSLINSISTHRRTSESATPYSLIGFNSTNFTPDQFSLQLLNPLVTAQTRFLVTGAGGPGEVQIIIDSIQATGPLLQNDPPVGIPPVADFTVAGDVVAGTPTAPAVINSLTFEDNSSLQLVNELTVTSGELDVPEGTAMISGKPIVVPGDFSKEVASLLSPIAIFSSTTPPLLTAASDRERHLVCRRWVGSWRKTPCSLEQVVKVECRRQGGSAPRPVSV